MRTMNVNRQSNNYNCFKVSIVTLILLALVCCPFLYGNDQSEDKSKDNKWYYGFGIGYGQAQLRAGCHTTESRTQSMPLLHYRAGKEMNEWLDVVIDIEIHPLTVENPRREEEFKSVYFLASPKFSKKNLYVQPGLGLQTRFWSGPNPYKAFEVSFAFGLAGGIEYAMSKNWSIGLEGVYRFAPIQIEGCFDTRFVGFRTVITWRR